MQTTYHILKSIFNITHVTNATRASHTMISDFSKFDLISKLPFAPYYNEYKFIPTIHKTSEIPQSGLYFNKEIYCADDMVYQTIREFNDQRNKNIVEYKALGFQDRLKQMMMQASMNPLAAKAKYIIFTCNGLGAKYNNSIIGVFENSHSDVDPNMRIEYELYNTIEKV
jgi:hypothetical protein